MSEQGSKQELSIILSSQKGQEGQRKTSGYIPGEKSGKWSEEEHMKYIVFIDYNKEKMRSKQKRRSNKFYEEMSQFISTRNSLQCRSHHQKLEEKYTHVNKIISVFKPYLNKTQYKALLERLDTLTRQRIPEHSTRTTTSEKVMVDTIIQTDIQDINVQYITVNPHLVVLQKRRHELQIEQMRYPPPPLYYPQPTNSYQLVAPQTYPYHPFGWYADYHSPPRY